ncbi:MAG: peptidylprolyl isomerase [Lachnospiraceae bacterium]|nr:peptidylprolyl isomerase [Lachnospiraceae bacterium]
MKKISIMFLCVMSIILMVGCAKTTSKDKGADDSRKEADVDYLTKDTIENLLSGKHHAEIEIIDYGVIEVELDADSAPVSVTNFVNLAKEKFYDGLTFHRIISGFVIQGGDPNGDGTGGSDNNIIGEFINNGVDNQLSHKRGALSMARSANNNSASSQFFICHEDALSLNADYAAFGHVTEGMEIVDAICKKVQPIDGNGTVQPENQPVIKTIKIID